MKCKVCGVESGKYPLCRACNIKKEKGEIFKCENAVVGIISMHLVLPQHL